MLELQPVIFVRLRDFFISEVPSADIIFVSPGGRRKVGDAVLQLSDECTAPWDESDLSKLAPSPGHCLPAVLEARGCATAPFTAHKMVMFHFLLFGVEYTNRNNLQDCTVRLRSSLETCRDPEEAELGKDNSSLQACYVSPAL